MNLEEATAVCKRLEDINFEIWNSSGREKRRLNAAYRVLARSLVENGWKVHSATYHDANGVRHPGKRVTRLDSRLELFNANPSGEVCGDCTTRCLATCLGVDYETLRREQEQNAAEANRNHFCGRRKKWNTSTVWHKSLLDRGWIRIPLSRRIQRGTVATLLAGIPAFVATISSGHVAAVKGGKVFDTWQSTGGRVKTVIAPHEFASKVRDILETHIVLCV